jgi:hypothetical protein
VFTQSDCGRVCVHPGVDRFGQFVVTYLLKPPPIRFPGLSEISLVRLAALIAFRMWTRGTGGGLVKGIVALMAVPISSGPTAQYLQSVHVCNTATPGDVGNYRGAGMKK